MTQAKQHIDNLRTEKLKKLEDSEFRGMVETLTNQLSDPAHLIPELLQNAEDAGAAHVRIQLDENRMLFQHDGARFEEEHVEAICGMCQSTKKSSLDYIGTFGVGFKSTFAVSRNPEIRSGSYSFRFDEETAIVPEWVNPEDAYSKWNVTIILPLKKDEHSHESVLKQLEGFEEHGAKPMIFLRRLTRISIHRNGTETLFEKFGVEVPGLKKLGEPFEFVEIRRNRSQGKRFCVYTMQKSIPPDLVKHVRKKRRLKLDEGHHYETSVKIAFEIGSDGHAVPSTKGLLSVFLPTKIRTFLAFDVNAGFLLSTDRESLESVEDKYNCWLLERAVEAFEDIIESYRERAPEEFWPDIYRLFPAQEGTREPWLEETICVPIKDSFRRGGFFLTSNADAPWRQLNEVVEASKDIRELFPAFSEIDCKPESSGRRAYLSEAIDAGLREALVKEFELAKVDEEFLLDALSEHDVLKGKEAAWLLSLFALLSKKYSELYSWTDPWKQKQFLNRAKECYLIPCEDGSIVRLSEGTVVYRSISDLPDFMRGKVLELREDLYKALTQEVKEEEARKRQQLARELVWELIREAKPENLYKDIIQPEFERAGDGELDEQVCKLLDSYVVFLKDNNVTDARPKFRVRGERRYEDARNLFLTNEYLRTNGGELLYDLEKLLQSCEYVWFITPDYLELDKEDSAVKAEEWRVFLTSCKVKDWPEIKRSVVFNARSREDFAAKYQKATGVASPHLEGRGKPYTGHQNYDMKGCAYRLMDFSFESSFENVLRVRLEKQDTEFFTEFLRMLDFKGQEIIRQFLYLRYLYADMEGNRQEVYEKTIQSCCSCLGNWLRENEWIPAWSLPGKELSLRRPSDVYLFNAETAGMQGAFYIEPDNIRSLELRALLGLRTTRPEQAIASSQQEESLDALLEKYGRWAADSSPLDKEKEKFIKRLYQRVSDSIRDEEDAALSKFKTHVRQVYDASRNWNELSRVRYYVSDVLLINELRDDVRREVMFLPGGLDHDSVKPSPCSTKQTRSAFRHIQSSPSRYSIWRGGKLSLR